MLRAACQRLGSALMLGAAQGYLGWYMVKSGLVDNPHVSHFRLAAHLGLAFCLFGYLEWIALGLIWPKRPDRSRRAALRLRVGALGLTGLIGLQIVYGAFVAGLDAGYTYNTFPKMLGHWVPPGLLTLEPMWRNALSNPTAVQFIHRVLALVILAGALAFWIDLRASRTNTPARYPFYTLLGLIGIQIILGIATLIAVVPVSLAVAHQLLACLVWGAAIWMLQRLFFSCE